MLGRALQGKYCVSGACRGEALEGGTGVVDGGNRPGPSCHLSCLGLAAGGP